MRIIGGVRVFFHTTGEGVFHCRRCCADRQYRGRSGRRFVTVFFVPLVPLGKVGEHVQCRTCGTRYHAGVLGLPATADCGALTRADAGVTMAPQPSPPS